MDEEEAAVYNGSLLSKFFGRLGGFLDVCAVFALCSGNLLAAVLLFVVGTGVGYTGYRLARRRQSIVPPRQSVAGPTLETFPVTSASWVVVRMDTPAAPDGFLHVLSALGLNNRPLIALSATNLGVESLFYPPRFSGQQSEASVSVSGLGIDDATYRAVCRRRGSDSVASFEMDQLWHHLSNIESPVLKVRVNCGSTTVEYQIPTEGCADATKEWLRRIDADLPELAARLQR